VYLVYSMYVCMYIHTYLGAPCSVFPCVCRRTHESVRRQRNVRNHGWPMAIDTYIPCIYTRVSNEQELRFLFFSFLFLSFSFFYFFFFSFFFSFLFPYIFLRGDGGVYVCTYASAWCRPTLGMR